MNSIGGIQYMYIVRINMTYLRSKLEFVNHQITMTLIGLEMLLNKMNRVKMWPAKKGFKEKRSV